MGRCDKCDPQRLARPRCCESSLAQVMARSDSAQVVGDARHKAEAGLSCSSCCFRALIWTGSTARRLSREFTVCYEINVGSE